MNTTHNDTNYDYTLPIHTCISQHNNINEVLFKNNRSTKFPYFNARSLNNKVDEIQIILKLIKTNIIIIAISETWLNESDAKFFKFSGYKCEFACRPNRKGGGADILIKEQYEYTIDHSYSDNYFSIICVKLNFNNTQYSVTTVYRPPDPNVTNINTFLSALDTHINTINNTTIAIVLGDFNFDSIETPRTGIIQSYINMMEGNNMHICDYSTDPRSSNNLHGIF